MLWYSGIVLFTLKVFIVFPVSGQRVTSRKTSFNVRVFNAPNVITVPGASLEQCTDQCTFRQKCRGINYSRVKKWCELLEYTDEATLDKREKQIGFVYINRVDIIDVHQDTCDATTEGVCNPDTRTRSIKECPTFRVAFGEVKGNMQTVGSKVIVNCNANHILSGESQSVCQEDGTWSSLPSCLWDCGEPPDPLRNSVLDGGETTNGSVRTYHCTDGFFISGNRLDTERDAVCVFGGSWRPGPPRCVKDCNEPREASFYFAESRIGEGLYDNATRSYTCRNGTTVFVIARTNVNRANVTYNGTITNEKVRESKCNGVYPAWSRTKFRCVKACTNRPSTDNVNNVTYYVNETDISALYECRNGYSVFINSRKAEPETAVAVCNESGSAWSGADFVCKMDCKHPPDSSKIADVTYSFSSNLTLANYACADGYMMANGSTKIDLNRVQGRCDRAGGNWTFPTFTCEKDCQNPPDVLNIDRITYTFLSDDTLATYACAAGHVILDGSTLTNQNEANATCSVAGGYWSNTHFLCAKDCVNAPNDPNLGTISYDATPEQTVAIFTCASDYAVCDGGSLTSEAVVTCDTAGGNWSYTPFTCVKNCVNAPNDPNLGTISYDATPEQTVAIFTCASDYAVCDGGSLTSEAVVTCDTAGGNWSYTPFTCVKNCVNAPNDPNLGTISYDATPEQTVAIFTCASDYAVCDGGSLTSEAVVTCDTAGGNWSYTPFTCVKNCVNAPNDPNLGTISYDATPEQTVAMFTCASDYAVCDGGSLTSEAVVTCDTAGGNWSYTPFTCVKTCGNPPAPPNVDQVTCISNATHTITEYACASGHVISYGSALSADTSAIATCDVISGIEWAYPDFTCVRVCQPALETANTVSIRYTVTNDVTSARITCASGHVIAHDYTVFTITEKVSTCTALNGQWQPNAKCVKVCQPALETANTVSIRYTVTNDVTSARITCASGHVIAHDYTVFTITEKVSTCTAENGQWQPNAKCVKDCGAVPDIDNVGYISYSYTQFITTVTYWCKPRFMVSVGGERTEKWRHTISCTTAGGLWQNIDFKCVEEGE